jgi:hypothetical protein
MRQWPVAFGVGLAVGILGTALLASRVAPYLSEAWRPKQTLIVGEVLQKVEQADRVRLVLETEWGALLATFTGEAGERVRVLVEEGDEVTFAMAAYQAFVDNPMIARVVKGGNQERRLPSTEQPG